MDVQAINTNNYRSDLKLPCKVRSYITNYEKVIFSGFKYLGEEKGMRGTEYEKQGKIQIINTQNTP